MQESEREEIKAIIRDELARHGLQPDEPAEDRALIDWSREHMRAFKSAGNIGWRGVMLAVVTGGTIAIWEGIKVLIQKAQ